VDEGGLATKRSTYGLQVAEAHGGDLDGVLRNESGFGKLGPAGIQITDGLERDIDPNEGIDGAAVDLNGPIPGLKAVDASLGQQHVHKPFRLLGWLNHDLPNFEREAVRRSAEGWRSNASGFRFEDEQVAVDRYNRVVLVRRSGSGIGPLQLAHHFPGGKISGEKRR
jgi:hypothetical protein